MEEFDELNVVTKREVMNMAKDPVCGMQVDEKKPGATSNYQGKIYYFCSPSCKRAFENNPVRFVKQS
jgi:YHS domain-containing protein